MINCKLFFFVFSPLQYHWIEWDTWDGRTRRYAILERKIIFEKNKKNGIVSIIEAEKSMLESLQKDVNRWNQKNGVYDKNDQWQPKVKVLDEVTNRSKIFEIIGNDGELISFGHTIFEIIFSVKLR